MRAKIAGCLRVALPARYGAYADNCTGPSRVSMTRLDLIGKMLGAQDISVETTDSDGKPWSAVFTPRGMRMAARETLGFCGINADAR